MSVECANVNCWYRENPDRISEYNPGDTYSIGYNDIASVHDKELDHVNAASAEDGEVEVCTECFVSIRTTPCYICKRDMMDAWITPAHFMAAADALGRVAVPKSLYDANICRRCLDYEDMNGLFGSEKSRQESAILDPFKGRILPVLDADVVACANEWGWCWLRKFIKPSFSFYTRDCPTRDAREVDAKVRDCIGRVLLLEVETARLRCAERQARKEEETQRRIHNLAKEILQYIPVLSMCEAKVFALRIDSSRNSGRMPSHSARALFGWALDYRD